MKRLTPKSLLEPSKRSTNAPADAPLDLALRQLRRVDLPPWAAVSQLQTARNRLHGRGPASRFDRYEPALLIAFSALHLVWVLWRVFDLTP